MSASVAAGVDAAPVLEFAKHVFHVMALAIEERIVEDVDFAVRL